MSSFWSFLKALFGSKESANNLKIATMRGRYKLGCVSVPKDISKLPKLSFATTKFQAPRTVDLRDYCTQTENQGNLPYCAAYTAVGFAENILWRKNDYISQIDPVPIYKRAKQIDGDPYGEGTSLTAVLQVLLEKGYFNSKECRIQVIDKVNGFENSIKYAIHKFGCLLLACDITEEWYLCGPKKTSITGKSYNTSIGGHAILCCGYNEDGVIIHNSWGEEWGQYGFALITWAALKQQFIYAAVLSNALNNIALK